MQADGLPDVASLAAATVEFLRHGPEHSHRMRQLLAGTFGIDQDDEGWPRFVNNHAWALVRLQAQGTIRKIAAGCYELAPNAVTGLVAQADDVTPPIRDEEPLPRWARQLVLSASWKNARKWNEGPFAECHLRTLWKRCSGVCALSGKPFREAKHGSGRAQRPYAPSLDRIDPRIHYTLENCRLVLTAVNFALNAWGDEVFLDIAEAATLYKRDAHGKPAT